MASKKKWQVDYGSETDRYKWTQTKEEVLINVPIPQGTKGKDITCEIKSKHLKVGLKGKPLIIDGDLGDACTTDDSTWIIDKGNMEITLTKGITSAKWWKWAIVGEAAVDPEKIEGSQYVDESLLRKLAERDEEEEKAKEAAAKQQDIPAQEPQN